MEVQATPAPCPLDSIKRYDRMFLGHPLGLFILSMNEVWERFSFYGMKTILILYMVASKESGGLGLSYVEAGAIYGLYGCLTSVMILPGGWIADVLWGPRKALLWGGVTITFGHLAMALDSQWAFFAGLGLIILGTGLLKPSSTVMVSQLYPSNDPRQESGYTIYYMCINVGALIGALVVGYLGQRVSWHFGFGAAAIGMILGLIVYILGYKVLGPVGRPTGLALDPVAFRQNGKRAIYGLAGAAMIVAALVLVNTTGLLSFTFGGLVQVLGIVVIALPIVYFTSLFRRKDWSTTERNNLIVIVILFAFATLFIAAADQRGSILTLFADEVTHCTIGSYEFPSTWFVALNGALVITLAPLFAWLWPKLGKRNPSIPAKFAWALFFSSSAFAVMVVASLIAGPDRVRVGPEWLFMNVVLMTIGEMFLGPVGVAAFARLAPRKIASQMMAVWFMKGAIAGLLAGMAGGAYKKIPLALNFGISTAVLAAGGILLMVLGPWIRRLIASK